MLSFYTIFSVCLAIYTINADNVNPSVLQKPNKLGNSLVTIGGESFTVESMIEDKKNGKYVGRNNVIDGKNMDVILDKIIPSTPGSNMNMGGESKIYEYGASKSSEESVASNESVGSNESPQSLESDEKFHNYGKQGKGNFQHFPLNPQQNINGYNGYNMQDGRYGNMRGNENYGYNNGRYPQSYGMPPLPPPPPPPPRFNRYQQSYWAPPSPPQPPPPQTQFSSRWNNDFWDNFQQFWTPPPPPPPPRPMQPMQSNGRNKRKSDGTSWQTNENLKNQENVKRLKGNQPNNNMMGGNKSSFHQNQIQPPTNSGIYSYNSNIPNNGYSTYDNGNYGNGNDMFSSQQYWNPPSMMSSNGLNDYNNQQQKNQYQITPDKNTISQYGDIVGPLTSKDDWYLNGKQIPKTQGGKLEINNDGKKLNGQKIPKNQGGRLEINNGVMKLNGKKITKGELADQGITINTIGDTLMLNGKKVPRVKASEGLMIEYGEGALKVNGDKKEGFDGIKGTGRLILGDNINPEQNFTASGKNTNKMDQFGNLNSLKTNNNIVNSNKRSENNKFTNGGLSYSNMYNGEALPGAVTGMKNTISKSSNGMQIGGINGLPMGMNKIRIGGQGGGIAVGA